MSVATEVFTIADGLIVRIEYRGREEAVEAMRR
jgi:hypothetical protein